MPVDQEALASRLQSLLRTVDLPVGTESPSLVDHLNRVIEAAQDVLSIDGVGLILLDEHNSVRVAGVSDAAGAALERCQQQLGQGPAIDCMRNDTVVRVTDLAEAPDYAALWQSIQAAAEHTDDRTPRVPSARAVLSVPVRVAGNVVGTLNALRSRPHDWTPEEVTAVEAYAGLMGVLLRLGSGLDSAVRTPPPPENK
ncbi:GAF domain-containing protein [Actinoplanes sp. M2I2]|uniref:GAF domain-containing protein n=1 Tax=Actinoplanes sp. M2I2 TaxID=1734444 RepID=UPI0020225EBC|nr:GAF domain-containing protein [Actinoplanes sp. M2I2]